MKIHSLSEKNLPKLSAQYTAKINANEKNIRKVLAKSYNLNGLGRMNAVQKETLSFDDVMTMYNPGIRHEEIEAWVWYRRKKGIPMYGGWKKYYINDTKKELNRLVESGALFYEKGELLPTSAYMFGNMYDKLLELEKDSEAITEIYGKKQVELQRKLIKEATPAILSVMTQDASMRPKISPLSKFARKFQITEMKDASLSSPTSLLDAYYSYLVEQDKCKDGTTNWEIRNYYLDGSNLPKDMSPENKADLRRRVKNNGEQLFQNFLYEGLPVTEQQKIDLMWNRTYNGDANIDFTKIPIGFEASAKFKSFDLEIRPAQREGVAYMEAVGSGIIAYDVGVGKTMTAIIEMANALYCGKCKRPLVVVPNATYKKWIEEVIGKYDKQGKLVSAGILSNTGVTVNDWFNLGVKHAYKKNKAMKEKSITFITYEGLMELGFSNEIEQDFLIELANIVEQSGEKKQRDTEINYEKLWEKIGLANKDTSADFDKLGFDYLVIDEAHNFKNIFDTVKVEQADKIEESKNASKNRKMFNIQGQTSGRAIKAFFLSNYIQRKFGRNIMLLTATPFTNSPLEVYSMLSLVARDYMTKMGIENIVRFFETFVETTIEYAVDYKGDIVNKEVVKSFRNRLILQKLIFNHINYKTGEEAGVKRPLKVNLPRVSVMKEGILHRLPKDEQILTYLKFSDWQKEIQKNLNDEAAEGADKDDPGKILRIMGQSLNNALSPFIYADIMPADYIEFVEKSPKIEYVLGCIKSVKDYHEKRGEQVSGQVIYLNRGKAYFQFIIEYLIKEIGYKEKVQFGSHKLSEVEVISSGITPAKKELIKEAFLAGVVKVIIGTATIREGIDLQTNGTVIYNMYPDWNPTDMRQLEGRIWRQGNKFGYVRIVSPLMEDSMDVFVYQKLDEKQHRINDLWYRGDRGNVLNLEGLDAEEVKMALLTDVSKIASMKVKEKQNEMKIAVDQIEYNINYMSEITDDIRAYNHSREAMLQYFRNSLRNIEYLDLFAYPLSEEQIAKKDKDERASIKRQFEIHDKIKTFLNDAVQGDTEILRLFHSLKSVYPRMSDEYKAQNFRNALARVRKAEKNILIPRGFTIDSDMSQILRTLKSELEIANKNLSNVSTDSYFAEVEKDIAAQKKKTAVAGANVANRIAEFVKTNNLLNYKFNQVANLDTINLPDGIIVYDDKTKMLKLFKFKMAMAAASNN